MLQFGYKRTIHAIPLYVNPFFSSPNVNFLFLFLVFFRFFHDILWPLSRPPHSVRGLPCAPRFPASNFWRNHNILSYFSASPCQIGDPNRSSPVFPQKMLRFSKGRCIIYALRCLLSAMQVHTGRGFRSASGVHLHPFCLFISAMRQKTLLCPI